MNLFLTGFANLKLWLQFSKSHDLCFTRDDPWQWKYLGLLLDPLVSPLVSLWACFQLCTATLEHNAPVMWSYAINFRCLSVHNPTWLALRDLDTHQRVFGDIFFKKNEATEATSNLASPECFFLKSLWIWGYQSYQGTSTETEFILCSTHHLTPQIKSYHSY